MLVKGSVVVAVPVTWRENYLASLGSTNPGAYSLTILQRDGFHSFSVRKAIKVQIDSLVPPKARDRIKLVPEPTKTERGDLSLGKRFRV